MKAGTRGGGGRGQNLTDPIDARSEEEKTTHATAAGLSGRSLGGTAILSPLIFAPPSPGSSPAPPGASPAFSDRLYDVDTSQMFHAPAEAGFGHNPFFYRVNAEELLTRLTEFN